MRKVSAIELNQSYAEFLIDHDESKLAEITTSYVSYVSYSVPANLRSDFVQDVMLAIVLCRARARITTSYSKWTNGVISNMRADMFKTFCREKELLVSGEDLVEEYLEPYTPTDQREVRHQLDAMHATLSQSAGITFDLLRQGMSLVEIARIREVPYVSVWQQFRRMKLKFKLNPLLQHV